VVSNPTWKVDACNTKTAVSGKASVVTWLPNALTV